MSPCDTACGVDYNHGGLMFLYDRQWYMMMSADILQIIPDPPVVLPPLKPAGLLGILLLDDPIPVIEPGPVFMNIAPALVQADIRQAIVLKKLKAAIPAATIKIAGPEETGLHYTHIGIDRVLSAFPWLKEGLENEYDFTRKPQ